MHVSRVVVDRANKYNSIDSGAARITSRNFAVALLLGLLRRAHQRLDFFHLQQHIRNGGAIQLELKLSIARGGGGGRSEEGGLRRKGKQKEKKKKRKKEKKERNRKKEGR